ENSMLFTMLLNVKNTGERKLSTIMMPIRPPKANNCCSPPRNFARTPVGSSGRVPDLFWSTAELMRHSSPRDGRCAATTASTGRRTGHEPAPSRHLTEAGDHLQQTVRREVRGVVVGDNLAEPEHDDAVGHLQHMGKRVG